MKEFLKINEWSIIEDNFNPANQELSESIFSIGNGYIGQRANFEEKYSGKSLQGSYIAGVYYPDKTRVGWWKNGYPEYFAKVLNSTNWIGINIKINGIDLDFAKCKIKNFCRELNMKEGYLKRSFTVEIEDGKELQGEVIRFISLKRKELGAIKYTIKPINFKAKIQLTPYLDGDVKNEDSNYDEKFWDEVNKSSASHCGFLMLKTKKLDFHICSYMQYEILKNNENFNSKPSFFEKEKYVSNTIDVDAIAGDEVTLIKYVSTTSNRYYKNDELVTITENLSLEAKEIGFNKLLLEQSKAWALNWQESDIIIKGDKKAQQGIRFNIFQLNQTYNGEDSRLNIGPKGFTGEKYGGSTYWDTEAYCLPFYLSTSEESVAKNLLLYRHKHLDKAIENAKKLGFNNGAALYPMVTMNGEECHNEWEITFEEIHRNGAIAHAIYNYVNYTGEKNYLAEYGFDVLVGISRFWAQRINYSTKKNKFVMLGVTGPNEYDNNVNNNWYTNRIAVWTLEYTLEVKNYLIENYPEEYNNLYTKLNISEDEFVKWNIIINNMYYPMDNELNIFLQQDNYLDKEQILVKDLDKKHLPINQNWSWDRILRSCFIKQADVLQGIYLLEDKYDIETIKRNFYFYEPRTVHESSLSPCIHAILASSIGDYDKAYEMYLRTSRLDLDNYNNDTEDGCHTTSMAGTWMSIVHGFGGLRVKNDRLVLNPFIPKHWDEFSFKIMFRGSLLKISVSKENTSISNESALKANIKIYEEEYTLAPNQTINIEKNNL
ncbi:glycoside hydrolase family 65 protein [Clostridium sp. DL1XJH146]